MAARAIQEGTLSTRKIQKKADNIFKQRDIYTSVSADIKVTGLRLRNRKVLRVNARRDTFYRHLY